MSIASAPPVPVAVLLSGRGSNLAALLAETRQADSPARIALVVSDKSEAGGLAIARDAGIPAIAPRAGERPSRRVLEAELEAALAAAGIAPATGLVCLAGFMRVLSAPFVERWLGRMLNIHPSLLPAFPGLDTHARVLAAAHSRHGATVHLVSAEVDAGPVVVQGAVEVLPGDTPETLAARVLAVEHRIYPLALRLLASGALTLHGDRVIVPPDVQAAHPDLIWPG